MPVFLQFRLWLAQGSARERMAAGGAAALAVVLLVLASLPLTDGADGPAEVATAGASFGGGATDPGAVSVGGDGAVAPGGATSAPSAGASTGGAGSGAGGPDVDPAMAGDGSGGPAAAPGPGAPAAQGGPDCSNLQASAPGITPEEVVVGAAMVNLAGPVGNSAFSIRPDLDQIVDVVVEHINANGGVACGRKVVVRKYDVNPIDVNDQQAKCLQMVQDGVFSVIDIAGYARPVGRTCFVQNELPHQISTSSTEVDLQKGYPYLYGENASSEKMARDGILGLHELGFFAAPGMKKLGLLVDTCDPSVEAEIEANLRKIGVGTDKISKYKMNCALVSPPNEVLQGVVQHKSAGVTHVFLAASLSNSTRYTQLAAQQDFRPQYGVSDYGTLTAANATWDRSAAGAIGITSTRRGELNSGIRNALLEQCHALITSKGLEGIEDEKADGTAGFICDAFAFWKKAIDGAGPNPTRLSLVESGLPSIGAHQTAIGSDGVWDRKGKVAGGDFHRTLKLDAECLCMKVVQPEFKPGF